MFEMAAVTASLDAYCKTIQMMNLSDSNKNFKAAYSALTFDTMHSAAYGYAQGDRTMQHNEL